MLDNRFIGWSGLAVFACAIALTLLLAVYPLLERYTILNPQAGAIVAGILALVATVLGCCAFKTAQGKVAAIGGLILLTAIVLLLSLTTVVRVEQTSGEQSQAKAQPVRPFAHEGLSKNCQPMIWVSPHLCSR